MLTASFHACINDKIAPVTLAKACSEIYRATTSSGPADAESASGYPGPNDLGDILALPSIITDIIWLIDCSFDLIESPNPAAGKERGRLILLAKQLLVTYTVT